MVNKKLTAIGSPAALCDKRKVNSHKYLSECRSAAAVTVCCRGAGMFEDVSRAVTRMRNPSASGQKELGKPDALASGLPVHRGIPDGLVRPTSMSQAFQLVIKSAFDLLGAIVALVGLWPMLVIVAIAVKLDSPGPIFVRQVREGRDGVPFTIYKFRTMHAGCCDSGHRQARSDDPRVTRLGRLLRASSIDELPQLLNIVRGDMSFVGPRPHVPDMDAAGMPYRDLVPYYSHRLAVRPGLSGWAQINGLRGSTEMPWKAIARIDHDLAYVQNFSLGLDLKIIVLTVWREVLHSRDR
jgi:polysaccharide biosynthesis protein PslA